MKRFWLLICALCVVAGSYAQEEEKISSYLFNEFQEVTVFFKNGGQSKEKMNYNFLSEKFYFIDPAGEIKVLSNPQDVIVIRFGERVFYPEANGGVEILPVTPVLYVQYKAHIRQEAAKGAYGMSSETTSIRTFGAADMGNGMRFDFDPQKLYVGRRYNIYWIEKNGKKKPFKNFKQFVKLYPKHKEALEEFIKENKLDFNNIDQIKMLLIHAEGLTQESNR